MTARRQRFAGKSILDAMFLLRSLFAHTYGSGSSKRYSVQLCLEQLEDRITPSGPTLSALASFDGTNGDEPASLVEGSSGNLFGTTKFGGENDLGSVFEVAAGSGTITTLASFNGSNGDQSAGAIVDIGGNLFGITGNGGTYNDGTVYEVQSGSGTITTLASFNGASPNGLCANSSGNLFGTTYDGGAHYEGSVFEVAAGTGTITTLASFNGTNGRGPIGGIVEESKGDLFGITESGGTYNDGTVYEVKAGSGTITTVASFGNNESLDNVLYPDGDLVVDSNGNLFGTGVNFQGGGTLFEVKAGSGTITTLASPAPGPPLLEDSNGNFFGIAGISFSNTVYEVKAGSSTITPLASFNGSNGYGPVTSLIEGSSGNLFGTTAFGGSAFGVGNLGYGAVFELTLNHPATTLIPTSLKWDTTEGGVDFGYQVSNSPVPQDTEEALYWSSNNQMSGIIGGPVYTQDIPAGTVAGSYGPFNVPASALGTPPQGAKYLLAVTDPNNVLGNFDPSTNVTALAYNPQITPTSLAWDNTAQGGIDFDYQVSNSPVLTDTQMALYWSSSNQFSGVIGGPVYTQSIPAGTAIGSYGPFHIDDSTLGSPPAGATYLLAVADPNNVLGTFDPTANVALIPVPTWTGAGATDLWSDGGNWLGGVAPTAGSDLVFPAGALQETNVDDLGFTFGSIITSDAYSFSGQPITANSLIVSQGSLELDSPTTVTNSLSVAVNTTLIVGSGITGASLTLPANATLSLDGSLFVNLNATLQDDGTTTVNSEGDLYDFGVVNIGVGGTLTAEEGLLLVAFGASCFNFGTMSVGAESYLADEGVFSIIDNGTVAVSGMMNVGDNASLTLSNGSLNEAPGAAMDVEGAISISPGSSLSFEGEVDLAGNDNGFHIPADSTLISTPITPTTPSSTKMDETTHQVLALESECFEVIEKLSEFTANQLPGDFTALQAKKLAAAAGIAGGFANVETYSDDINALIVDYYEDNQGKFGSDYSQLVEHVASDLVGFKAADQALCGDGGGNVKTAVEALFSDIGNRLEFETYYTLFLKDGVTSEGSRLYTQLKNRASTAGPGVGGTLNDQGSVTVSPTGNLSDQDAITVGSGATLTIFGNLTEGASGAQQVFGTLVVEPAGTLDIIGSLSIEPGGSFIPLGSISVAPGGIANLPSGVSAFGTNLFIVGGQTTNDQVQVKPLGTSQTGSTGVQVNATLNGAVFSQALSQSFSALYVFGYAGNENVQLAGGLTLTASVTAGNGNDNVTAGSGNNTITLGNGNDNVHLGDGNNIISLGDGNDKVNIGNGNDTVTLGNGNDNTQLGNGNNVLVEGNGHDNITAGNGDNLIVAGLGQHSVLIGNGSNILIDGSARLTEIGDSLTQVLTDWITYGSTTTNVASVRSRLAVTYNNSRHNTLIAGTGLDWFFATYAGDIINRKPTDVLN